MPTVTLSDRAAWLAYRAEPGAYRIGASAVGACLGLSPYTTPTDVWAQHQPGYVQPDPSPAMLDGIAWEPIALGLYAARLGRPIANEPHTIHQHHDATWLGSTLDGVLSPAEIVEVKTDRRMGAAEAWPADGTEVRDVDLSDADACPVPAHYWLQVQTQLACSGAEVCHLLVCLPRFGLIMPEMRAIKVYAQPFAPILNALRMWREAHLVAGERPDPTNAAEREALARWRYPERPVKRDAAPDEARGIAELLDLRDQRDAADAAFADLRSRIVLGMGDAAEIVAANVGKLAVTKRGVTVTRAK